MGIDILGLLGSSGVVIFVRAWVVVLSLVLVVLGVPSCIGAKDPPVDADTSTGYPTETTGGADASASIGPADTTSDPTGADGPETGDTGTSDTGIEPSCGNDIAEASEECDGTDLADQTCEGQGFSGGTLMCSVDCSYDTSQCAPAVPVLQLSFLQIKVFDFSWDAVAGADYYQLSASPTLCGPPPGDIVGESISFEVPLHFCFEASYTLLACNMAGCTASVPVAVTDVMSPLAEPVGYFKASNTGPGDNFGFNIALSDDGTTLAVGAPFEDSAAAGVDSPDQGDFDPDYNSGAVYVFVHDGLGTWSQQAYIKASNAGSGDLFGLSVALSEDGNTLAVGAHYEASGATGVDSDGLPDDNSVPGSGAVYVFLRDGMGQWSQQAYVKASNAGQGDNFGFSVALSDDGDTLAVGAIHEDSNAIDIDGNQGDVTAEYNAGAAYVFARDVADQWSQQTYVKASNTGEGDRFGSSIALSGDGNTLAVGAYSEDSNSGAVYVSTWDPELGWQQPEYIKASNADPDDYFGTSVALDMNGDTLVVGAVQESSNATGVGGIEMNNNATDSGAVYVFGGGTWEQRAYVKASNTDPGDRFGKCVALSSDGSKLAVGARWESGDTTGVGGGNDSNGADQSGAAYVYEYDGMNWSHRTYVKAPNTDLGDNFGFSVALSGDGQTLAIGAYVERSNATGINGNQADDSAIDAGAVYLY